MVVSLATSELSRRRRISHLRSSAFMAKFLVTLHQPRPNATQLCGRRGAGRFPQTASNSSLRRRQGYVPRRPAPPPAGERHHNDHPTPNRASSRLARPQIKLPSSWRGRGFSGATLAHSAHTVCVCLCVGGCGSMLSRGEEGTVCIRPKAPIEEGGGQ